MNSARQNLYPHSSCTTLVDRALHTVPETVLCTLENSDKRQTVGGQKNKSRRRNYVYCVARREFILLTRKPKSVQSQQQTYAVQTDTELTFRTSSTTRHMKIAKKIDVRHYNMIISKRRTGFVFQKENLTDKSRSEAKYCSFHLVAKVARYLWKVRQLR
jgi:hypothetical protein